MEEPDPISCADRNRRVFENVLAPCVTTKLEQLLPRLPQGSRGSSWFDASGCVWCLFDDEGFERCGDAGRRLREGCGDTCGVQVYWSMGDVVMPGECDERWVAKRIAAEARRQLASRGYRCETEVRETEGEEHLGVRFRRRLLGRRG